MTKKANLLIHETSPYLLEHAYNPINCTPGVNQPLKRPGKKTHRFSFQLATMPAIGALLWKKSALETKKSQRS